MKMDVAKAELLGIMFGDGCLSRAGNRHLIYISGHKLDDFAYHTQVTKKLFLEVFNKTVNIGFRKKENTLFLRFSDKGIFDTFKSWGMPVGKKYSNLKIGNDLINSQFFFDFLRGLFDTDGCCVLSKQHRTIPYYPRIEITSNAKSFLVQILSKLEDCGFYGSISKKGNASRLELPGFKNLEKWGLLIGSNHHRKGNKIQKIL
ncbi:hypothetical protein HOB83_05570 [Candidatus Woesearchaeota archaeon]|nr:hypothetical protein [Candidatus Woesearchaeota archaeon]MBT4368546.1 hypothetical protein [Candidatus Woesearchaeota archaeon]MBT4713035.1 hypothetical protein [Candidatus Woesearchaeota archaeon]MBT6639947.1 hypothetical protein [Candidatus Woesearchaeota archaeon]MBT7134119.1 hypothetical protein [Candidatus Woesearchaeota archaeon]